MTDKHTQIAEQFAETIDLLIAAQEAWQYHDIVLTKQLTHKSRTKIDAIYRRMNPDWVKDVVR
ncbi:hypothetical protein FHQ26_01440 [Testudinibacter sp. TR-2022]|uniref:hypothetical protein n=1 Tax=Testudinibacter sp. TR-2022 TaxID=2585029 RepID=UPI00111B7707|nr:hypothetical protein [Testudinibacter sp. TR-2022]TNH04494.1 hypothetical protein FHQ22_04455 [Pasteurellaceae bacterium Phil31]TNH11984.1 hypothetical protein FHQ25_01480 [Testudinibacter sp. TR-2022]TNH12711.1 hypothetical protein FHQ26_01440 [Testudinibacter sp. TR-2022]TNH13696.1 hypothetical protein FIA56_06605 [Testudinibacter sp. TR-2022]TNH17222.1 hypothetical protein FHQ23_07205 [Testudinibacter sp. TR-2022]